MAAAALGLVLSAGDAPEPAALALPQGSYRVVGEARHDSYNLGLTIAPPVGTQTASALDIAFGIAGPGEFARLRWDHRGLVLERTQAGSTAVLRQDPGPFPAELARGGTVELRSRPTVLEVIAGERRVCRVIGVGPGRGQVATGTATGVAAVTGYSCQGVEPVVFGDDFMRTADEAADLGLWQPASGQWRLYSVMERIQANPDARIRDGREPDALRSPNPFCLAGTGPEGAFILAGNAFWTDYEAAVSVRSFRSDFGLVFAARDAADCWLVRWGLHSLGLRPARLELVQRRGGQERVAASTTVTGRAEGWYRLGVRLLGDRITVLVDEVPVLERREADCTGGRIGLFTRGLHETFFDDVTVRSVTALPLEAPELLSADAIQPLTGSWQIGASGRGSQFTGNGEAARGSKALALCALGLTQWPAQCLEVRAMADQEATFGVAFAVSGPAEHLRVTVQRDGSRGQVCVTRVTGGATERLAEAPCPLPKVGPVRLCVDGRGGVLRVRTEGVTRLRLRVPQSLAGPVGLVAVGRTPVTFSGITLFAEPAEDWEQPVIVERFANDPFMQGWASTRYVWLPAEPAADSKASPRRFIHNGDFYGPFRVTAPVQDGLAFSFGLDELLQGKGYRLETHLDAARGAGTLTLTRDGEKLAEAAFVPGERKVLPGQQTVDEKIGTRPRTPDTETYGTLELNRDGQAIWASVDGKELLAVHDPEPLDGRTLGLQTQAPLDFVHVAALRSQIRDELFERAAVDWLPVGDWDVTNRFACDPRWSHMNGSSMGVAALWSKLAFAGDFTIECYAGMRMRQEEMMEGADRMYYPRVGDINVALAGRAGDLFSGYNLILAAWDPMWTETVTQFRRLGEVMASTDRELIPRVRNRQPKARAIPVEWDPGGRPVHGAWYFVKVRKTGSRYDVWFDNVPVFSVTDPSPLAVERLALWTQHNSIVLARVKIGYRHSDRTVETGQPLREGAAPTGTPEPAPAPRLCSPSHPRYRFDMEDSAHGFTPWNGDQSVEPTLEARGDEGLALRLENLYAGGDAGVRFPLCGIDLGRSAVLELEVAAEPQTLVNLYLVFADRPAERCFVPLTGPREEGPNLVRLGPGDGIPADGQWHRVRCDLGAWARERFPWRPSFRLAEVMVGMLHEGYLNAGLGGNPAGCVYELDNVRLEQEGGREVAVECHADPVEGLRWRAWLAREPTGPAPAGQPDLSAPCVLLPADGPGDWFVRGEWLHGDLVQPLAALPVRVGAPLAVVRTEPAPATAWGGDQVRLVFAESAGHPDLAHSLLTVAGAPVPINQTTATYDPAARQLGIRVRYAGEVCPDKGPVEIVFETADTLAGSAGVGPEREVIRPRPDLSHTWTAILDYALDREPPTVQLAPTLLPRADFNRGLEDTVLLAPRDECRLEPCPGPDGTPALQLVNSVCGSGFNVRLNLPPFLLGRFPRLAFDYRVDPYAQCDFMFRYLGQQATLGFTDGDETGGALLGLVGGVVRDSAWHHADVDLLALRPRRAQRQFGQTAAIAEVGFGDWIYPSNAPGATVALDNVSLVPVVGTATAPLEVAWTAHDISGIRGYSYVWDKDPTTEPGTTPETAEAKARVEALPAGEAYLHVRACDGAGNWGPAVHGRFLVDNEPPEVLGIEPAPDSTATVDRFRVRFGPSLAGLDPSGLALAINGKTYPARGSGEAWDAGTSEFTYDMLADWSLLRSTVADGSSMSVSLSGLKDFAGNPMKPLNWSWKVAYALDQTGPQPPRLWGYGQSFEYFDHFSGGAGLNWRPYGDPDGADTEVTGANLPEVGPCLQIRKVGKALRFAAYRSLGQLTLKAYPVLAFDYCLTPGTQANLLLFIRKEWYQIGMTGSDRLPALGRIADAKADGQWRHAEVDLAQRVREALPDLTDPEVRLVAFGDWTAINPDGSTIYLDNLALLGPSCPLPLARYSAADATGIRDYRLSFSRDPREQPGAVAAGPRQAPVLLAAADAAGTWYIHAQAQDGAGNWGEVLHFPYQVTEPVAQYDQNGYEAGGDWRIVPEQRASQGHLYRARSSGANELVGVQFVMQAACDMEVSRSAAIQVPPDTVLEADLYLHGDRSAPVAACLRPAGGNGVLIVGERLELQPGVWHRGVRLGFPPGTLDKAAGAAGGTLKVRDLGLVITPARLTRPVFLIDHLKINGALSAG